MRWRPWRACRGSKWPHDGWFATGAGVPKTGRIRWGRRIGWARAWIDSARLAWTYRKVEP